MNWTPRIRMLVASAAFAFTLAADAQVLSPQGGYRDDPYNRNDPYYRGDRETRREERREERQRERRERRGDYGYGTQSGYGYGYGSDPLDVVTRIQSDVRMIASNNYSWGKNERKHFEEVEEELGKFTRKYRDGKYDRNNLKDASESLQELTRSNTIQSRDRRVLSDALTAVERLRSGNYDANARYRY
jgi:hypothetical protein